mmetsp:Transcript_41233/g.86506  ORF Transcript_41233/g.86506 Transcript_41233/m.86506 type:complete len:208 (+) Transcript_41233:471-1094(+)
MRPNVIVQGKHMSRTTIESVFVVIRSTNDDSVTKHPNATAKPIAGLSIRRQERGLMRPNTFVEGEQMNGFTIQSWRTHYYSVTKYSNAPAKLIVGGSIRRRELCLMDPSAIFLGVQMSRSPALLSTSTNDDCITKYPHTTAKLIGGLSIRSQELCLMHPCAPVSYEQRSRSCQSSIVRIPKSTNDYSVSMDCYTPTKIIAISSIWSL